LGSPCGDDAKAVVDFRRDMTAGLYIGYKSIIELIVTWAYYFVRKAGNGCLRRAPFRNISPPLKGLSVDYLSPSSTGLTPNLKSVLKFSESRIVEENCVRTFGCPVASTYDVVSLQSVAVRLMKVYS
jgi:hypothetical protein